MVAGPKKRRKTFATAKYARTLYEVLSVDSKTHSEEGTVDIRTYAVQEHDVVGYGRTSVNESLVFLLFVATLAAYGGYLRREISRVVIRSFFQVDVPLY